MQQKSTREYRNNLFVTLFGKSFFARENFLSLYNALHGTQLTLQDVEIKPCMLENTVYAGGLYNDVSMQIDDKIIVLVEQQTTINFNMPLRFLEYVTRIYEQFYSQREKYNRQPIKIPSPEFYVIYNGKEDYPAESEMNLSDAFCNHEKICKNSEEVFLNLKVKVYNINSDKGIELLNKCKPLKDYTAFNDFVLEAKSKGLKDFVGYALDKCIEQDILVDFIKTVNREM